mmetsp:Transcript_5570/g.15970  ORF Transcript_5570/g.15970 Transcript_5570/m.15970 type:complete len:96 (+) Transcript_5570:134-421(+)
MTSLLWNTRDAFHNPVTGSFHSPPHSKLLEIGEDREAFKFESAPADIFPPPKVGTARGGGWLPRRAAGLGEGRDVPMLCHFCCPGLFRESQSAYS